MFKPGELEGIPFKLTKLFSKLGLRIMEDIVRRIRINGEITRSADWQIYRLHELGVSKRSIKKMIKDTLELSTQEINHIYKDVLRKGYERDSSIYKYKGKPRIPFEENSSLQQLIKAVSDQTNGEMKNITQSMGFAVKQPDGTLAFKPVVDYYQETLDNAMMDISTGAFDYNTVLKRTVSEMTNSGLRTVDYASGVTSTAETAARRAVMTGFNQTVAKITDENAKKLGTDYFEVTWHGGARPSHQVWQGKVFTRKQLVSVCGLGSVQGLCGANCYHTYFEFNPETDVRQYTDEWLEKMNKEENTPKEYINGKSYTKYEALQRQRYLERKMRAQRKEIHLLKKGGADEEDIITARARYRATSTEYTRFSKAMNLPEERDRVTIDGLGNIGQGKYTLPKKSVKTTKETPPKISTPTAEKSPQRLANNVNSGIIETKLTENEKSALNSYISSDSYKINEKLRSGEELSDYEKSIVENLDNALQKMPKHEGTVFRSLDSRVMENPEEFWKLHQPGAIVGYKAFASSSLEVYDESMDIQCVINSKNGRDITAFNENEKEILFARNSEFIITEINGKTIFMEEV